MEPDRAEERKTVSITLPPSLIREVALYEVESGAKSRSHAVEDLIERGLAVVGSSAAPEPERVSA